MKVDLPDGGWAELNVPKHLRQSDVVDIVEYAENNGIDLEGKHGIRVQMGLANVLLARYIVDWSLRGDDGEPVPVTMGSLSDMPIHTYRVLAAGVTPLLQALTSDLTEPDPLSGGASSSTAPTG